MLRHTNSGKVKVGGGCKPLTPPTSAAPQRDYRMATPQQTEAYRERLIAAGLIRPPAAS